MTTLLAHLARRMMSEGVHSVPRDVLVEIARSTPDVLSLWNGDYDGLIEALFRTNCLIEEPAGRIAFVHRALLEYFSQSYLGPIDQVWTPSIVIPQKTIEVVRFVDGAVA